MSQLTLYELPPSPNSIKVRLALGLKGIPCRRVTIDPANRAPIVELSGQPLTPVMLDGDRVIYDSYAILRYLDANYPDGPRLYSPDRDTQREIEGWELSARTEVSKFASIVFGQLFSPTKDPAELARANELLAEQAARFEDVLADRDYLLGEQPTAADLTCAPLLFMAMLLPKDHPEGSVPRFFADHVRLPERFARTRAWAARVMAFDCAR